MNAWDKSALGFVTPKVIPVDDTTRTFTIKPAATGSAGIVAFKVQLPNAYHDNR